MKVEASVREEFVVATVEDVKDLVVSQLKLFTTRLGRTIGLDIGNLVTITIFNCM